MIEQFQTWIYYLWFIFLAGIGGIVKTLSEARQKSLTFTFKELFIDFVISGFTGLVTMYLLLAANVDLYTIGALTAISGHMGPRAWVFLESRYKALFGPDKK